MCKSNDQKTAGPQIKYQHAVVYSVLVTYEFIGQQLNHLHWLNGCALTTFTLTHTYKWKPAFIHLPRLSTRENSWTSKRQWKRHYFPALCIAHSYCMGGTLGIQMALSSLCSLSSKSYLPGTSGPARTIKPTTPTHQILQVQYRRSTILR